MPPSVPRRRSLVVRLLVTSTLIALASIAATAWLAVHTTTEAVNDQRTRPIADQTRVYDALLGYAATHSSWTGVGATVDELSKSLGQRVTLLTPSRRVIADSTPHGPRLPPSQQSATINPLRTPTAGDSTANSTFATDGIDPRAVGPYRLPAAERSRLNRAAHQVLQCMGDKSGDGSTVRVITTASGRPTLIPTRQVAAACIPQALLLPTPTEARALRRLARLTNACMNLTVSKYIDISPAFELSVATGPLPPGVTYDHVLRCVTSARRTQLAPYVAPAATLVITDVNSRSEPRFTLTKQNTFRLLGGVTLILLLAVVVTVLAGRRLVRPLRELADHVEQPIDQQQPIAVQTRDEIGHLAEALNDHLVRRREGEQQRQAIVNDVAHELRTPLSNILSWIEAAQDGIAKTDAELLELLHDEAELLQHVVEDLRDLAAADAGTLRVYPELIRVDDAIAAVVEAHHSAAQRLGLELTVLSATDVPIWVDPVRFRQVVGNLLSNAISHTQHGGRITVRAMAIADTVVVEVADDGEGIASADLPFIFDRFWRADSSRSRTTGGSGLGLSIVHQLVEAHGGTIDVVSHPGRGSTFTVRLPLGEPAGETAGIAMNGLGIASPGTPARPRTLS